MTDTRSDILDKSFVPNKKAMENRVGDETVILHLEDGNYYGLDLIGTYIWKRLGEGKKPRDICSSLCAESTGSLAEIETDTRLFLAELCERKLLIEA